MADIGIAIIGHGFMGHEHETMLCDFPGDQAGWDFRQRSRTA